MNIAPLRIYISISEIASVNKLWMFQFENKFSSNCKGHQFENTLSLFTNQMTKPEFILICIWNIAEAKFSDCLVEQPWNHISIKKWKYLKGFYSHFTEDWIFFGVPLNQVFLVKSTLNTILHILHACYISTYTRYLNGNLFMSSQVSLNLTVSWTKYRYYRVGGRVDKRVLKWPGDTFLLILTTQWHHQQ